MALKLLFAKQCGQSLQSAKKEEGFFFLFFFSSFISQLGSFSAEEINVGKEHSLRLGTV